jgi:peptidoglycan/LPS O-acetylase OafA/YrhL
LLGAGWFFPGLLFWFTLGIAAGGHMAAFKGWVERLARPALLLAPFLVLASMLEWETLQRASGVIGMGQFPTFGDALYAAAVLIAFLGGSAWPRQIERRLQELGVRSFGIYLVHGLGLILMAKAVYHLAPQWLPHQWLFQPLLFAAGLALPLALMWLVDRSPLRRFYKVLFG